MVSNIRGFLPDPTQSPLDSRRKPPSSTNHTIVVARTEEPKTLTQQEAIIKGYKLLSMLSAESITPTIFTSLSQLRAWGYETHANPINILHDHYFAFHHVMAHLAPGVRINAIEVCSRHEKSCTRADGIGVPSTSAFFVNSFDAVTGVLVAGSNFNPEYTIGDYKYLEGEALPSLRHWSDMVYLQSQFIEGERTANLPNVLTRLKAVVRHRIENLDTNMLIHTLVAIRVVRECWPHEFAGHPEVPAAGCEKCCEMLQWPGVSFSSNELQTVALLGTPNGRGVAYLLKQHSELTGKTVTGVTIWCEQNKPVLKPSIVFWIGDPPTRK